MCFVFGLMHFDYFGLKMSSNYVIRYFNLTMLNPSAWILLYILIIVYCNFNCGFVAIKQRFKLNE